MKPLPDWMRPQTNSKVWDEPVIPEGAPHKSGANRLARKALDSLAALVSDRRARENIASRSGLLQSIDARAKIIALIGLVVTTTLLHSLFALAIGYLICISLAVLSKLPAKRVAAVWLAVPFFSVIIMLPATLNLVTPGKGIITLYHFANGRFGPWIVPNTLEITDTGLFILARFVLRSAVCVTFTILLASTTTPSRLLKGLRALGVPRMFVTVLSMMERYISVLAKTAGEIHLAKMSRSISAGSLRQEHDWVASGIGSLYRRTQSLGHNVYLAMISRGYTGDIQTLESPRWQSNDWLFVACIGILIVMLLKV